MERMRVEGIHFTTHRTFIPVEVNLYQDCGVVRHVEIDPEGQHKDKWQEINANMNVWMKIRADADGFNPN